MTDEDKKTPAEATPSESTEATVEAVSVEQRLKDFKECYITAASAIDKLKEPLAELIQLKQTIEIVL